MTALTNKQLKRNFIVLKNKQLNYLSPVEALEVSKKLTEIKKELIKRDIEPKSLV